MIKSVRWHDLRKREAYRLYAEVLHLFEQETGLHSSLKQLCDVLSACLSEFEAALEVPDPTPLTAELTRLDVERMNELRRYIFLLKYHLASLDAEKSEYARILLHCLLPAITKEPYCQKTDALDQLLQLLKQEEYMKYIHFLQLEEPLTRIRDLNARFRSVYAARAKMLATIKPGAVRSARRATHLAFRDLCNMLNALSLVNGEAEYIHLIDGINQLLAEVRKTLSDR